MRCMINQLSTGGISSGSSLEYFADDVLFSGTKKADALTWNGQCVYKNTNASTIQTLTDIITDKIKLGLHSIVLRLKTANNIITADVIKVEIFKNIVGSFVSQSSKTFKPTALAATTDYDNIYVPFEYKGGPATNNQVKLVVTLLTNATVFEVSLDSITILPSTIGIVG